MYHACTQKLHSINNMMFVSFNSNMTGVACGAGTANSSGTAEFTPGF